LTVFDIFPSNAVGSSPGSAADNICESVIGIAVEQFCIKQLPFGLLANLVFRVDGISQRVFIFRRDFMAKQTQFGNGTE